MNLYSVTYTLYERNPNAEDSKSEWTALDSWTEDILAGSEESLTTKATPTAKKKLEENLEPGKERRVGVTPELVFAEIDLTPAAR
jgi:hypothetical protein